MAILGALYEGSFGFDDEWRCEENEVDDIVKWFTEMGFEEPETLTNERPKRSIEEVWTRNNYTCPQPPSRMVDVTELPLSRKLEFRTNFSDSIPRMSCNLENDLEDFLNWENQHTVDL